ncbi:MAG: hypothetical protein JJT94_17165 [Bernardetiaceae bacterium]|nr:hypothetical protein [Bernardetiaceae bacterium]
MNPWEILERLLYLLLPSSILLYGMYLVVKSFMLKDLNQSMLLQRGKNQEAILPVRLTAYERMTIFLERITPTSLVRLLNSDELSAIELEHLMILQVREEYNHNIAQQIYMSPQAWELIQSAMEETISLINSAARELEEGAPAMALARAVMQKTLERPAGQLDLAILHLKQEAQELF